MREAGEVLISVQNVSKKFCKSLKRGMRYGMVDLFTQLAGVRKERTTLRKEEFWAVKNISFELRRGECIGLIGRNGAGKSTLLKMINGLIRPDTGSIRISGKIGALIELGAGFNPLLTGRENIYVNGQLLGFSKQDIDKRMPAILEFAEINDFIDSPVQNYSSGMKVRLGFAVAAQMEPDVLIIDEVLAVGDLGFVLKCFNRIDSLLKNTAVIFVSHSMPQVSRICTDIMVLEKGGALYKGNNISEGIDTYYARFAGGTSNKVVFERGDDAALHGIQLGSADESGENVFTVQRLDTLRMFIDFSVKESIAAPFPVVTIMDKEQRPVGICQAFEGVSPENCVRTENGMKHFRVKLEMPHINLSKGIYSVTFALTEHFRAEPLLRLNSVRTFQVLSEHDVWPPIEFEGKWS